MEQFIRCRCPECTKKLKVPDDFADDLVVACTRCRHPYTVAQLKLAAALQAASQGKNSHGHEERPKVDAGNVADRTKKQFASQPSSPAAIRFRDNVPSLDSPVAEIKPSASQGLTATAVELTAELVDIVIVSAQFTWRLTGYLVGDVLPCGVAKLAHLSKHALAAAKPKPFVMRLCLVSCVAGLLFMVARMQFSNVSETTPGLNALSVLAQQLAKQGVDDAPSKKQATNSKSKVVKQPQSNPKDSLVAKAKQNPKLKAAFEDTDETHKEKQASARKQQDSPSVSDLFSKSKKRVVQFYNQNRVPQRIPPRPNTSTYRRSLEQQRRWRAAEREAQYEVDRTMQQFREQTTTQTPWLYWE